MHNKLSNTLTQGMCKLKNSRKYSSLVRPKVVPAPVKREEFDVHKASFLDTKFNLSRNFLSYSSVVLSEMSQVISSEQSVGEVFRLSNYDCVGFDLDNTVCRYKLTAMVKLEYDMLSRYLVNEKGYSGAYLFQPLEKNLDFVQKGLVLDFARGNVLQINGFGYVKKASHGTKLLSDDEIVETYGVERKWGIASEFTKNMLEAWNGPLSEKIRTLLDYFDMPASLVFARIVDSLDAKSGHPLKIYNIWPDILDALINMYKRENFMNDSGGYFPALKSEPHVYINKCSDNVLDWLKAIKKEKVTFLITGSNIDFASLVASNSMGEDWRSLFDIVICYARKPGFFTGGRPFLAIDGVNESLPVKESELQAGKIYSQGNWQDLYSFLKRATGKSEPKCVYIGDNLIQDVYTPSRYTKCDTVAVVEELLAEGMTGCNDTHSDSPVLVSKYWGSYFCSHEGKDGSIWNEHNDNSLWTDIIQKHAKICVPSLDFLAKLPLDHNFPSFVADQENRVKQFGYYPNCPASLIL